MPFAWNDLGAGPADDEIEVSVFGPGFGECIVVHVGGGEWLTVDSCIDSTDQDDPRPVAERYLRAIGVSPETQVKFIVASHWHDDHVRGLARLVDICRNARFSCANSLVKREFIAFVEAMGTGTAATDGAKVKEFRQIVRLLASDKSRLPIRYATGSRELISWHTPPLPHGKPVTLRSLSPSDHELALFLERIARELPTHGQPKRASSDSTPNLVSVVLHLDLGVTSILLGADMEIHNDTRRGWTAVLEDAKTSNTARASLFKVAHHGSSTGHHDQAWAQMLDVDPMFIVTPFNKLPIGKKLPTKADVERIRAFGRLFLTGSVEAAGRSKSKDAAVGRSLKENGIVIRELRTPLGLVRMRRGTGPHDGWNAQVFAPASEV